MACDLEDCQDEDDALKRHLKELELAPVPSTFSVVAAASGDKPLTKKAAPAHVASTSAGKKPVPIKPAAGLSTVPATTLPATQGAGLSGMKEDPYRYSLSYNDNEFNDATQSIKLCLWTWLRALTILSTENLTTN